MEKASRKKKAVRAAPLRGQDGGSREYKGPVVETDMREKNRNKLAKRRLKREAFLLKLETASQRLEEQKRGPQADDMKMNDVKKALPLIDWEAMGLDEDDDEYAEGKRRGDHDDEDNDNDNDNDDDDDDDQPRIVERPKMRPPKPINVVKAKEQVSRVVDHDAFKQNPLGALEEHLNNCFQAGVLKQHPRSVTKRNGDDDQ